MSGFTDKPIVLTGEDIFGINRYITGLSDFIMSCNTPMTVAIQGDWGSGKTSVMNLITDAIRSKVVVAEFNTWRYSQFNKMDELPILFLTQLVKSLNVSEEKTTSAVNKTLKIIGGGLKESGLIALDMIAGGRIADKAEEFVGKFGDKDGLVMEIPEAISKLKEQFQLCVYQALEEQKKKRVVYFIDDLDRLNPGKAVELLEILKLFLDCDKCVFVLAIDYAVVSQGVKEKYGELVDEKKGKDFFDKIIQVPFKMPIANYKVDQFVQKMLAEIGIEDEPALYVSLIQASIGCNPRAMKRLFNAYLLLNKIYVDIHSKDVWTKRVLFAILCMQQYYEKLYNYIIKNKADIPGGTMFYDLGDMNYYKDEEGVGESLMEELGLAGEHELRRITYFVRQFNQVIDQNQDGKLSPEELEKFMEVLNYSTVTSTVESTQEEDERWNYRTLNRSIAKEVNERLSAQYPHLDFRIYQPRKDYEDWKFYDAESLVTLPHSEADITLEFRIASDFKNKKSKILLYAWCEKKSDKVLAFIGEKIASLGEDYWLDSKKQWYIREVSEAFSMQEDSGIKERLQEEAVKLLTLFLTA